MATAFFGMGALAGSSHEALGGMFTKQKASSEASAGGVDGSVAVATVGEARGSDGGNGGASDGGGGGGGCGGVAAAEGVEAKRGSRLWYLAVVETVRPFASRSFVSTLNVRPSDDTTAVATAAARPSTFTTIS